LSEKSLCRLGVYRSCYELLQNIKNLFSAAFAAFAAKISETGKKNSSANAADSGKLLLLNC
jgi:hypothetical protein